MTSWGKYHLPAGAQTMTVSVVGSGSGKSDTPRTDALALSGEPWAVFGPGYFQRFTELCRQLERELAGVRAVHPSDSTGIIAKLRGYADAPMISPDHCVVASPDLRLAADWIEQMEREHRYLQHEVDRLKHLLALTPDDGYVPPKP